MLDLEAIRLRCEAATPGPWRAVAGYVYRGDTSFRASMAADAQFAAAARTDIPALITEVERLRAALSEAQRVALESSQRMNEAEAQVAQFKLDGVSAMIGRTWVVKDKQEVAPCEPTP
jgi:hypothetical protein